MRIRCPPRVPTRIRSDASTEEPLGPDHPGEGAELLRGSDGDEHLSGGEDRGWWRIGKEGPVGLAEGEHERPCAAADVAVLQPRAAQRRRVAEVHLLETELDPGLACH